MEVIIIENIRWYLQKHKKVAYIILCIYIAFNGCWLFPFSNELFPFNVFKAYLVLTSAALIGVFFALTFDKHNTFKVLIMSLFFTPLGMLFRYLVELGEVSNTRNFTTLNIVLFIIIMPICYTIVYWLWYKFNIK